MSAAGRDPDRDESLRRVGWASRRDRAPDGDGRRLARLASQLSILRGRKLDRVAPRRAHCRAQRASADETVHAAQDRKGRPTLNSLPSPPSTGAPLVSAGLELTFAMGASAALRSGSLAKSKNPSAPAEGRPRRRGAESRRAPFARGGHGLSSAEPLRPMASGRPRGSPSATSPAPSA